MDKRDIYHLPAVNTDPWNRTLCSVLEEMRKCYETRNFAPLHGLIEEAQTYGNRMESKLSDIKDYERLKERHRQLKTEVKNLKEQSNKDQDSNNSLFD